MCVERALAWLIESVATLYPAGARYVVVSGTYVLIYVIRRLFYQLPLRIIDAYQGVLVVAYHYMVDVVESYDVLVVLLAVKRVLAMDVAVVSRGQLFAVEFCADGVDIGVKWMTCG